jgi:hypothetical protein
MIMRNPSSLTHLVAWAESVKGAAGRTQSPAPASARRPRTCSSVSPSASAPHSVHAPTHNISVQSKLTVLYTSIAAPHTGHAAAAQPVYVSRCSVPLVLLLRITRRKVPPAHPWARVSARRLRPHRRIQAQRGAPRNNAGCNPVLVCRHPFLP